MSVGQRGFTIFDICIASAAFAGAVLGAKYGAARFGVVGGAIGAALGGGAGLVVGRLPYAIALTFAKRSLEKESTQRLRERLRSGKEYYITHLLLANLMARGEDIAQELPFILELVRSNSPDRRRFGLMSLQLGFPDVAEETSIGPRKGQ
jgi:hypothetical protein